MLKSQAQDNGNLTITVKWSLNGNFILPSVFMLQRPREMQLYHIYEIFIHLSFEHLYLLTHTFLFSF